MITDCKFVCNTEYGDLCTMANKPCDFKECELYKKQNYFFYEWLILAKNMTEEKFKQLTSFEFNKLMVEYKKFEKVLR